MCIARSRHRHQGAVLDAHLRRSANPPDSPRITQLSREKIRTRRGRVPDPIRTSQYRSSRTAASGAMGAVDWNQSAPYGFKIQMPKEGQAAAA